MPPIFAILSDKCRSRFGRRKPFILGSGAVVAASLLLMARAKQLGALLSPSADRDDGAGLARAIAGAAVYAINMAMQPLHLGVRALAVDFFPPRQQPIVGLWSSRCSAFGAVFLALVGYSSRQPSFEALAVVSAAVLAGMVVLVTAATPIRDSRDAEDCGSGPLISRRSDKALPFASQARRLWEMGRKMPPVTRRACRTQLLAWFAWFPVLQYSST